MCNWRKWVLPGLIAVALLTGLAGMLRSGPVEKDLTAKAGEALSASHSWASVELDGRDLKLSGLAPSDEAIADAARIAGEAYDVRVVDASGVKLLPEAKPFTVSAVKTGDKVELTGYAPSAEMREQIASTLSAALPGIAIDNKLELARGMPQGFDTLAGFGMAQLAGLTDGTASLSDLGLSVSGKAASLDAYDAVTGALSGALPAGGTLAAMDIQPPVITPYILKAEKNADGIVLDGYVPSNEIRGQLVDAAKSSAPNVVDNLRLAAGQPEGFAEISGFGLGQLKNFSNGTVSLENTDLSVRGTAVDTASYDAAMAALSGAIPGGAKVAVEDVTPASVSPYTWSIARDSQVVVLNGYAPSPAAKVAFEADTQKTFPDARIVNRLAVAAGVPDGVDYAAAGSFLASQLSGMTKGTASVSDNAVEIDGMASTPEARSAIATALAGTIPGGLTLARSQISEPVIDPYVWSMTKGEASAEISGYVPDKDTASLAVDATRAKIAAGSSITDNQKVGAGAPTNFAGAMSVAIQSVSRLVTGKAEINGTDVTVSGEALTGVAANEIRARVANGLPPGYLGKTDLTVRTVAEFVTPQACQSAMSAIMENDTIQFESGKSAIKPDSFGLLDRLAFEARRCPEQKIEIGGHTDSDGSEEANIKLSQERSNAVRDYLVRSGVLFSRLIAKGYGEANPVADNSTAEGKAKNRRIDFRILN